VCTFRSRKPPPPKDEVVARPPERGAGGGRPSIEDKIVATLPNGLEDHRDPHLPRRVGEGEGGSEVPNGEGPSWDWDVQARSEVFQTYFEVSIFFDKKFYMYVCSSSFAKK
jgi:hypothetical protein